MVKVFCDRCGNQCGVGPVNAGIRIEVNVYDADVQGGYQNSQMLDLCSPCKESVGLEPSETRGVEILARAFPQLYRYTPTSEPKKKRRYTGKGK